jgi:hypothetical protein
MGLSRRRYLSPGNEHARGECARYAYATRGASATGSAAGRLPAPADSGRARGLSDRRPRRCGGSRQRSRGSYRRQAESPSASCRGSGHSGRSPQSMRPLFEPRGGVLPALSLIHRGACRSSLLPEGFAAVYVAESRHRAIPIKRGSVMGVDRRLKRGADVPARRTTNAPLPRGARPPLEPADRRGGDDVGPRLSHAYDVPASKAKTRLSLLSRGGARLRIVANVQPV